jgi:hypothetical protein
MSVVSYNPTADEVAAAQAWTQANGYGSVLTPWALDTQGNVVTVPTSAGSENVRFGFGQGVLAAFAQPGGTSDASSAQPAPAPTTAGFSLGSPLVLAGIAAAVWFLFLRKKR